MKHIEEEKDFWVGISCRRAYARTPQCQLHEINEKQYVRGKPHVRWPCALAEAANGK